MGRWRVASGGNRGAASVEKSLTKLQARNVFFGGSLFFFVVFVALVLHSHFYIVNTSTDSSTLNESVAKPESARIRMRFERRTS